MHLPHQTLEEELLLTPKGGVGRMTWVVIGIGELYALTVLLGFRVSPCMVMTVLGSPRAFEPEPLSSFRGTVVTVTDDDDPPTGVSR